MWIDSQTSLRREQSDHFERTMNTRRRNEDDERRALLVRTWELNVSDLQNPGMRELVRHCDLIYGIDDSRTEGNETIFFGRALLEDVARGRAAEWEPGAVRMAKIHYDQRTDSLECLLAAVQVLKGKDEYPGWDRSE